MGWVVSIWDARSRAKNLYLITAIDNLCDAIRDAETMSYEYWSNKDSKTLPFQLSQQIKSISHLSTSISNIDKNQTYPGEKIAILRKAATLNMEEENRPLSSTDSRYQRITTASHNLLYHYNKKF